MKRTIELPEELVEILDKYLKYHSSEELCRLLKSAIPLEPEFKDLSRLISLAALVKEAPENQVIGAN